MSSICTEFLRGLDFFFAELTACLPEVNISCLEVEACWIGLDFNVQ